MTTEQLAWHLLQIADRHREDEGFDFDAIDAETEGLKDESNFAAACERVVQILDDRFPSMELN
jgi:hypothetical protein